MVSADLAQPRTSRRKLEEGEEALPYPCAGGRRHLAMELLRQYPACVQDRSDPSEALFEPQYSKSNELSTRERVRTTSCRQSKGAHYVRAQRTVADSSITEKEYSTFAPLNPDRVSSAHRTKVIRLSSPNVDNEDVAHL